MSTHLTVPEWGEWGPYSENCEIRPEKMYQCARMRTRNCTNYSEFSACEGDQNSFDDFDPDDCGNCSQMRKSLILD